MPRVTSLAIALCLAVAACGHHGDSSSSSSSAADTRCGRSELTGVSWVGNAGWVGAGVGVFGVGYYGVWYDPGDTYDPVTDEGDVYGGYYVDSPDDSSSDDAPTGEGTPADDTAGEDDTPGDDGSSTQSLRPLAGAVNGCFSCTVGCTATDANGQREGQQATGVSDVSYDDACRAGVASLGAWSHNQLHRPLDTCQQFDPSADAGTTDAGGSTDAGDTRVPAAPTVGPR